MGSTNIGADTESICGKCGDVWHVVVAKEGDRVVKVQCKQCGGYHKHRPPGGTAKKTAGEKKPRAAASKAKTKAAKADELIVADPTRPPRAYSPKERFEVGDTVNHPSFGAGVVQQLPAPGKVEIYFASGGRKLLVHGR